MITISILRIMMSVFFLIELIVFPATINEKARRTYGRIFGTRIDTKIYHEILFVAASCVIVLAMIIPCL